MFSWGKILGLTVIVAVGLTLKGCGVESRQPVVGTMSIAAPEVVEFTVLKAPLRARFSLRNPAARAAFTGAFYTLDCTDTAGKPASPGVLIVTGADREAALGRLSGYDIMHVIELSTTSWAPRQMVQGEIPLNQGKDADIARCVGMVLKGAW
ncbi:hypothetical protein LZG00_02015 [Rhodobacteraceae bacterium LMO-12]|nr:hypothetical protein [Rhodobacteraceae bacterium LMO-JJ12]